MRFAPLLRRLALLCIAAVSLYPSSLVSQDRPFTDVADWRTRLKEHEARLRSESKMKIFLIYFYPLAGPTTGVLPPFSSADADMEEFLRRYVSVGLESVKRDMNAVRKRDYTFNTIWAGLRYMTLFQQKWNTSPEIRERWPNLLLALSSTNAEHISVLATPEERVQRIETLLNAYGTLDCESGRDTPRDLVFIGEWKRLVEVYASTLATQASSRGHATPETFREQVRVCEKAARNSA